MLSIQEIERAISGMGPQGMSGEDFERWLRRESRNVHAWGDEELIQAVLSVEAVLSEYRFGGIGEGATQRELANAIVPSLHRQHG